MISDKLINKLTNKIIALHEDNLSIIKKAFKVNLQNLRKSSLIVLN